MKNKKILIPIIIVVSIVIIILLFLLHNMYALGFFEKPKYTVEEFITNNKLTNIKKISEKPCYKETGGFLGLGYLSHDDYYKKIPFCKKIEYRGKKDENYYTFFVIEKGKNKIILESLSSQETYFPKVKEIITKLNISNNVKDIYISGTPDYSIKGNEFPVYGGYGNIAKITIYLNYKLKDTIDEQIFNNYLSLNNTIDMDFEIQYEDGYLLEFGYPWLTLEKNGKTVLYNNHYEIYTYSDLINRLK